MRILIAATLSAFFFVTGIGLAEDLGKNVFLLEPGGIIDLTEHEHFFSSDPWVGEEIWEMIERMGIPEGKGWQIVPQKLLPQSLRMSSVSLVTTDGERLKAKIIRAEVLHQFPGDHLRLI